MVDIDPRPPESEGDDDDSSQYTDSPEYQNQAASTEIKSPVSSKMPIIT